MSEEDKPAGRDANGRFQKGFKVKNAGNKKGSKRTALSDEKLANLLGKRSESAIEELGKIAMLELEDVKDSPQKLNAKLKAIMGLLTQDDKARDRIHRKAMDGVKNKLDKEKLKNESGKGSGGVATPVVSIKAVD
jgi:septation ring formation regulator EzrA